MGPASAGPVAAKYDPTELREPHSGKWTAGGGGDLAKIGHDLFAEVESANSPDQVVEAMRRQKAANPHLSTADLIGAADGAFAAKYPPSKYPQVDGFYAKLLADRHADIERPPKGATPKPAAPKKVTPKRPSAPPSDFPAVTAKQAQALQDGMPPPWTGPQRMALRYYTGNSAVPNGLLRGWIKPPGKSAADAKKIEAAQRNIEHAKAAMRPASQAMLVRRTAGPEQFGVATSKELDALVGHTMVERGFLSTTTAKSVGVGGKVKMEIEVPAGTPMAFVKSVSRYPHEDEVLLSPGLRYEVVSVSGGAGRPTVRVRVVPG